MISNNITTKELFSQQKDQYGYLRTDMGNGYNSSASTQSTAYGSQQESSQILNMDSQNSQNFSSQSPGKIMYSKYVAREPLFRKNSSTLTHSSGSQKPNDFVQQIQEYKAAARDKEDRSLLQNAVKTIAECSDEVKNCVACSTSITDRIRDTIHDGADKLRETVNSLCERVQTSCDRVAESLAVRDGTMIENTEAVRQLEATMKTIQHDTETCLNDLLMASTSEQANVMRSQLEQMESQIVGKIELVVERNGKVLEGHVSEDISTLVQSVTLLVQRLTNHVVQWKDANKESMREQYQLHVAETESICRKICVSLQQSVDHFIHHKLQGVISDMAQKVDSIVRERLVAGVDKEVLAKVAECASVRQGEVLEKLARLEGIYQDLAERPNIMHSGASLIKIQPPQQMFQGEVWCKRCVNFDTSRDPVNGRSDRCCKQHGDVASNTKCTQNPSAKRSVDGKVRFCGDTDAVDRPSHPSKCHQDTTFTVKQVPNSVSHQPTICVEQAYVAVAPAPPCISNTSVEKPPHHSTHYPPNTHQQTAEFLHQSKNLLNHSPNVTLDADVEMENLHNGSTTNTLNDASRDNGHPSSFAMVHPSQSTQTIAPNILHAVPNSYQNNSLNTSSFREPRNIAPAKPPSSDKLTTFHGNSRSTAAVRDTTAFLSPIFAQNLFNTHGLYNKTDPSPVAMVRPIQLTSSSNHTHDRLIANVSALPKPRDVESITTVKKQRKTSRKTSVRKQPVRKSERLQSHININHYKPPSSTVTATIRSRDRHKPPSPTVTATIRSRDRHKPPSPTVTATIRSRDRHKPPSPTVTATIRSKDRHKPPSPTVTATIRSRDRHKPPSPTVTATIRSRDRHKPPSPTVTATIRSRDRHKPPSPTVTATIRSRDRHKPPSPTVTATIRSRDRHKPPSPTVTATIRSRDRHKPPSPTVTATIRSRDRHKPPSPTVTATIRSRDHLRAVKHRVWHNKLPIFQGKCENFSRDTFSNHTSDQTQSDHDILVTRCTDDMTLRGTEPQLGRVNEGDDDQSFTRYKHSIETTKSPVQMASATHEQSKVSDPDWLLEAVNHDMAQSDEVVMKRRARSSRNTPIDTSWAVRDCDGDLFAVSDATKNTDNPSGAKTGSNSRRYDNRKLDTSNLDTRSIRRSLLNQIFVAS